MLLMRKNVPVAKFDIANGIIVLKFIYHPSLMPVGTYMKEIQESSRRLFQWLIWRSIPSNRKDIVSIQSAFGKPLNDVIINTHAVSLTDPYWIVENDDPILWTDVSFWNKNFSNDIFRLSIMNESLNCVAASSPDLTTNGKCSKAWIRIAGKTKLIKTGSETWNQDVLCANEVAAAKIAGLMGISHSSYDPILLPGGKIGCSSICFLEDDNYEFVAASQIAKDSGNLHGRALFDTMKNIGLTNDIEKMILFDVLINNTDRTCNNFGIVRDADTLEVIGLAPVYDNGECFGIRNTINYAGPFIQDKNAQLSMIPEKLARHLIPSKSEIKKILKETYEFFKIQESIYDHSLSDINSTYELFKTKTLTTGTGKRLLAY